MQNSSFISLYLRGSLFGRILTYAPVQQPSNLQQTKRLFSHPTMDSIADIGIDILIVVSISIF